MAADERTHLDLIQSNRMPRHVVLTKGLTQVTLGAPQSIYNGGVLRATVRYFDADRGRPTLPPDTAALVDPLGVDLDGRHLVVELPPGTSVALRAQLQRFCQRPSYAFPWHADGIPVPFPQ